MENKKIQLRLACGEDGASLLNIYRQYMDTPITFECVCPSAEAFAERIQKISAVYPYLVCECGGEIAGYAYAQRHKERAAYQWSVELSIYLDRRYTSCGIGKKMYGALFELLRMQGVRNAYGCVTVPNEKSERLHRSMGFRCVGIFRHTGYKCGAWRDVAWFERELILCDSEPAGSIRAADQLPPEAVREVLARYQGL